MLSDRAAWRANFCFASTVLLSSEGKMFPGYQETVDVGCCAVTLAALYFWDCVS